MPDFINKDSLEFVVKQTQADASENDITLGEPETEFLNFNRNTRLSGLSEKDSVVKNAVYLYYDRLDIADVFLEYEDNVDLPIDGATTTHDLIPVINAKYHVNLTPDDVVLESLNLTGEISITITDTSLAWLGTYNFTTSVPLPLIAEDSAESSELGELPPVTSLVQDVLRFEWPTFLRTRDNYIVQTRNTEPVIVRE